MAAPRVRRQKRDLILSLLLGATALGSVVWIAMRKPLILLVGGIVLAVLLLLVKVIGDLLWLDEETSSSEESGSTSESSHQVTLLIPRPE